MVDLGPNHDAPLAAVSRLIQSLAVGAPGTPQPMKAHEKMDLYFAAVERDVRLRMLPIVLLFLYQNAVYLPLHIEPRNSTPLYPSLLCLSAIGLYVLARSAASTGSRSVAGIASAEPP